MIFPKTNINSLVASLVSAGIFIGIITTAQFRSEVTANSFILDEINAQNELLKSFNEDRSSLKTQLTTLRTTLSDNQERLKESNKESDIDILNTLKQRIGLTVVRGAGLEITLANGDKANTEDDSLLIHAADLRDLVNLLRAGEAQAISINGQRVVASTTINSVGNTILVNNVHLVSPFKILAIGEVGLILDRMNDQKAYPDLYQRISAQKVKFVLKQAANLIVPAYDAEFSTKFIQKS